METRLNVLETNYEEFGVLVLDENEMRDVDGGDHYEWRNDQLVFIKD